MYYLEFLRSLHDRLAPRTYLEIGVAQGHTLSLSRCRSIGVDPAFHVDQEIVAPVSLRRCTSDDYFGRLAAQGKAPFDGLPIDLAYVDGMHLFEFALRDFINLERFSGPCSVIAFDDVLPRNVEEAARGRREFPWTGDVFQIPGVLAAHRPDLLQICVNTEPTGTLLVARLDPTNTQLGEKFDDIVRDTVSPDPQPVPSDVLRRSHALRPADALALELWDELRAGREAVGQFSDGSTGIRATSA